MWTAVAQAKVLRSTSTPLPGSNFLGGDGDQEDTAPYIDWQGLQAAGRVNHKADCPPPMTSPCPTASDDIFKSGSKELEPGMSKGEKGWVLGVQNGGGANPSDANILDSYWSFEHATDNPAFLYLAFTREASNGTSFITFELDQVAGTWFNGNSDIPCRTTGDILISFQPHGNVLDNFQVEEWITTPGFVDPTSGCATLGTLENVPFTSDNFQASFNDSSTPIDNFLPPTSVAPISQGDFAEAAINLSSVLAGDQEGCSRFASIWMYSQSSSSGEPSEMNDYVAPTPFVVRTCKAETALSSKVSGTVNRKARGKHRLRRHVRLATPITDTAILTGGDNPSGTITFSVYGPNNPTCTGAPAAPPSTATVTANGPYTSAPFTPMVDGVYRWQVTYSGDHNNESAGPTTCGIDSETVDTSKALPSLKTAASSATVLGNPISDIATLSGGSNPTGTITFNVYGPNSNNCTTPAAPPSTVIVSGAGNYHSAPFTPTQPGTYQWVADYSGDGNNNGTSSGCGAMGESVAVDPAPPPGTPGLTTTPSPGAPVGSPIRDIAHLTGGSNPTGTITFNVYGPNSIGCTTPAAPPSTVTVSGAGNYQSAPFTPAATGTYQWVASYSGDTNNAGAATSCSDSAETVVVIQAHPAIRTSASPASVHSGSAVGDTAILAGGSSPQGTITFRLFGPNDRACAAAPVFVGKQNVNGNGSYASPTPTPAAPGTYRWVATYSGDANNAGTSTSCGDQGETVVVRRVHAAQSPDESVKAKKRSRPRRPRPKFTG